MLIGLWNCRQYSTETALDVDLGSVLNLGRLLETSFYKGGALPSLVIMPYSCLRNF